MRGRSSVKSPTRAIRPSIISVMKAPGAIARELLADAVRRAEALGAVWLAGLAAEGGQTEFSYTFAAYALLAYHTACARGTDVDKPRNLAKSVTVE